MRTSFENRPDPHSHFNPGQPRIRSLTWEAMVDFQQHRLYCTATLRFNRSGGVVDLDTRDLEIGRVETRHGKEVRYKLGENHPVIGARLRLWLPRGVRTIKIHYGTSSEASALQWLEPEQTTSKKHPFVYTQCQAIHARSLFPCQDTPLARITYHASLTVPIELRAVMAADTYLGKEMEMGELRTHHWQMTRRIPPYLFGFAVGNLTSIDLSTRSRVWAEPEVVVQAAHEFAEIETIMQAAENLFGPYPWGRFDMLVLPPSFPYGGMENPTLAFLTPSILAGDRSAVDVVAHELVHAWTGNLVTNANHNHFWLNEGWTVYAELRLIEAVWGSERAAITLSGYHREMTHDVTHRFQQEPALTRLRTEIGPNVDPDDVFSRVPYCKGAEFLIALERAVGRETFDRFIRRYIKCFAFQSITTETFLHFLKRHLPKNKLRAVNIAEWVYGEGIPADAPQIDSPIVSEIERAANDSALPTPADIERWGASGLTLYLQSLPRECEGLVNYELILALRDRYGLSRHPNHEVRWAFLLFAAEAGKAVVTGTDFMDFFGMVGRFKYLRPLYAALVKHGGASRSWARRIFEKNRAGYHLTVQKLVQKLLDEETEATATM